MADYDTKAVSIGDVTVTASKASKDNAAERLEAVLEWLGDNIVDPGYGVEEGGGRPPRPDQSLPGGKPTRPDQGLPGSQPAPDQGLPTEPPTTPDQGLPGEQPEAGNEVPGAALGEFLQENAKEIAAAILKGTACDPAQPKK